MKIIQLVTRRQYRGAEIFAGTLSSNLVNKGVDTIFVGLYIPLNKALTIDGIKNIDLDGDGKAFFDFSVFLKLIKLLKQERPDVLQANGSDTLKYAVLATFIVRRIPVIYRNISIISSWLNNSFLKKAFYSWIFNRVDHVVSVGEMARESIVREFNLTPNRISVIRRGIAAHQISRDQVRKKLLEEFNLISSNKIVVHVGHFSAEKNHQFLLQVFFQVKKRDSNIKLLLVGEGDLFAEVIRKVEDYALKDTIFLTGFRSAIENIVGGADLMVLTSTVEGVPGVVLEAALYQVPTLAVDVGGIKEVITHNETGWLLPTHDVNLFADTLLQIINDEERLDKAGTKANHFVKSEFSLEANTERFIKLYKSLLVKNS